MAALNGGLLMPEPRVIIERASGSVGISNATFYKWHC
jgi:hypothetical protein